MVNRVHCIDFALREVQNCRGGLTNMSRNLRGDMPQRKSDEFLSRRRLFKRTGLLIAAAALHPAGRAWAAMAGLPDDILGDDDLPSDVRAPGVSPMMAKLSAYMSAAAGRALPEEVAEKAKQHTLDTLAAMISGSELPPGQAALKFARAYGGNQVATVAASNILCGPIEAALTNGMLAHSDETDDSHAPSQSHPGCAVVPAALAAAEQFGIDGMHFVRAVTLGYDVGPRVTMTLGAEPYENASHRSTHSIATTFGAAAAAGCAAGLNTRQMRWLLNYAGEQSSGLALWNRDTDHIEKAFDFAGGPARNGVTAAMVVHSGWTGLDDVFSGPDNFFMAFGPQADPNGLIDKLGERYEVARTDIKKWSAGMPIQAPLDAVENMQKQHQLAAEQVKEVSVRLAPQEASIVDNREIPDICLQHIIAVMLIDKTVSFRSAHDKRRMQDPEVLRQRAKVRLLPDEELGRLMPRRQSIVDITLVDGTTLHEHVDSVRGTAFNPMTSDEVRAKARDLMTPVLGQASTSKLIEQIFGLEKVTDIRELRPLLQKV
jgi:2-methylcitrate dehydratase PrpD